MVLYQLFQYTHMYYAEIINALEEGAEGPPCRRPSIRPSNTALEPVPAPHPQSQHLVSV